MKAHEILEAAKQHLLDRAASRDQPGGERSMGRTVEAFNAATGNALSERDGWLFMAVLKIVRACNTPTGCRDDYEDLAAYAGLAGECVMGASSWESWARANVPEGYRYVAMDSDRKAHAYIEHPYRDHLEWLPGGKVSCSYELLDELPVEIVVEWENSLVEASHEQ